jgi:hypothetical protein
MFPKLRLFFRLIGGNDLIISYMTKVSLKLSDKRIIIILHVTFPETMPTNLFLGGAGKLFLASNFFMKRFSIPR